MSGLMKIVVTAAALWLPVAVHAEVLGQRVGEASYFTNDYFGDGHDRWRSGGYSKSVVYETPLGFGEEIELRGRAEIISPWGAGIQTPDRAYTGVVGFGAFMHANAGNVDIKYGAEVIATGRQTGLHLLQEAVHEVIGHDGYVPGQPGEVVLCDCVYGMGMVEAAYGARLSGMTVRPFVEAQAGYETYGRVGVDVYIGSVGEAVDFTRDPVSGFSLPYKHESIGRGFGVVVGYDVAHVSDSVLLGEDVRLTPERHRLRAGVMGSLGGLQVFGGVSALSKEFDEQLEDQVVGVFSVNLRY